MHVENIFIIVTYNNFEKNLLTYFKAIQLSLLFSEDELIELIK